VRARKALASESPSRGLTTDVADEDLVGYAYQEAVRDQGCEPSLVPDCYRQWHRLAMQATVSALRATGTSIK